MAIHKRLKKIIFICFILFFIGTTSTALIYFSMSHYSDSKMFDNISQVPFNNVGVVLGTSRYLSNGYENPYFKYRIEAAAELYLAGKIKKVLVSGDNSVANYNEPADMRDALIEKGVAAADIHLDYAGFRTFDSMVRADKVFGLQSFTVISQEFHCERAIYIAGSEHINATGYIAKDPRTSNTTILREIPARVLAFADCHIIKRQPHFLGEKIDITANL